MTLKVLYIHRYEKVRSNHEQKTHSLVVEPENNKQAAGEKNLSQDDAFNYASGRLNLGLLVQNADDAVKEGDGSRIIRCWQFFLLYYKAYGHHKYAYAAFLLLAKVKATLTPAEAEQLIWNRTVTRKGGPGRNISCDLRLEQLNCLTKELLHNLGVNLDEKNAQREAAAVGYLEKMLHAIDNDLDLSAPSGHHKIKGKERDMRYLANNLISKEIFHFKPGRKHEYVHGFDKNLLFELDVSSLASWLKEMRKKLMTSQKSL